MLKKYHSNYLTLEFHRPYLQQLSSLQDGSIGTKCKNFCRYDRSGFPMFSSYAPSPTQIPCNIHAPTSTAKWQTCTLRRTWTNMATQDQQTQTTNPPRFISTDSTVKLRTHEQIRWQQQQGRQTLLQGIQQDLRQEQTAVEVVRCRRRPK